MTVSLVAAFIGCVIAAVGTGMITARCYRAPRADVIYVAVALLGLTVALGALTFGNLVGFGSSSFRSMELGAQVVAPLALCLALAEMAGATIAVRFAARLIVSALAVIAFVILSTDQLNPNAAFSKAWPAASVHYETITNNLLKLGLAPVIALIALIAIATALVRSSRDPAWRPAAVAVGSAGAAALALAIPAAVTLPFASMFALACLAAASLAWFAGTRAGGLRRDHLYGDPADDGLAGEDDGGWDSQDSWAGHVDQTGDFDALVTGDEGVYRGNGIYRPDAGQDRGYRQPEDDYAAGDRYRREAGYPANGHGRSAPDARYDDYDDDTDRPEPDPASGGAADEGAGSADEEARARLFGQIAIYTLLEGRADQFDLLTEKVVEQVRAMEPGTLVYIVHAVPSAPMQRILYEVYRDRAAYDEHRRRPYIARFESERRPYVLATNVIELGLQQAKVSPLPSISDLLGPSGPGSPDFIHPAPGRLPGSGQTGHSHSGPSQPGPGHLGPAQHGGVNAGPGESDYSDRYDKSRYDSPRHGEPGYGRLDGDGPGYSEPRYDSPRYGSPRYGSLGYDKPPLDGHIGLSGPADREEGPRGQW